MARLPIRGRCAQSEPTDPISTQTGRCHSVQAEGYVDVETGKILRYKEAGIEEFDLDDGNVRNTCAKGYDDEEDMTGFTRENDDWSTRPPLDGLLRM